MNNSPLPKVLLAILAVIAVMSGLYYRQYTKHTKDIRQAQAEISTVNYRQQVFGVLINEAQEYSKRNPAIEPILRSIIAAPGAAAANTAKPTSK